jgi:hypothetical protein
VARKRVAAAHRKLLERAVARDRSIADQVADGVRAVGHTIGPHVMPGSLWWQAPLQYVAEQMAPRVCAARGVELGRQDEVAAYLLAGLNEYVVALADGFDVEHFELWTAAIVARGVPEG